MAYRFEKGVHMRRRVEVQALLHDTDFRLQADMLSDCRMQQANYVQEKYPTPRLPRRTALGYPRKSMAVHEPWVLLGNPSAQ